MSHDTGLPFSRTVAVGIPTHEALALLPIPEQLSDEQRGGRICVYDGDTLTSSTAVDLGPREVDSRTIFPRACFPSVTAAAMNALFAHSSGPDACTECKQAPICETGKALNRVIRMGHR